MFLRNVVYDLRHDLRIVSPTSVRNRKHNGFIESESSCLEVQTAMTRLLHLVQQLIRHLKVLNLSDVDDALKVATNVRLLGPRLSSNPSKASINATQLRHLAHRRAVVVLPLPLRELNRQGLLGVILRSHRDAEVFVLDHLFALPGLF